MHSIRRIAAWLPPLLLVAAAAGCVVEGRSSSTRLGGSGSGSGDAGATVDAGQIDAGSGPVDTGVCTPDCTDAVCGDDGCGGSCGDCGQDEFCSRGQCMTGSCTPDCTDRVCGDDGCGGSCGSCGADQTCTRAGVCEMNACVPNCTNRACGDDGCGGSCGGCGMDQTCDQAGQCTGGSCTPMCSGRMCGDDGCGGTCGACMGGTICNAGTCEAWMPGGLSHRMAVPRPPALARQPVGTPFREPTFGTTLRRVSRRSEEEVEGDTPQERFQGGYETQLYSQLQAFSSDNQLLLLGWDDISIYTVRRMSDFSRVTTSLREAHVPRWSKTNPTALVHFDTNRGNDTVKIQQTDVLTGMVTELADLTEFSEICVNESFDELSHDGRWLVGMAKRTGESRNFNCRDFIELTDIFAYDLQNRQMGARINMRQMIESGPCRRDDRPDWVAPSPLGDLIVVQWVTDGTGRCNGLETFDIRTGAFRGRVTDHRRHGDLGVHPDGRQYFMSFEENTGPDNLNYPWTVAYTFLPGSMSGRGASTPIISLASGLPDHISCQGPDGSCVATLGPGDAGGFSPYETELVVVRTTGDINRLVHHRSSECAYWAQPRASMARDGSYVVFASDWDNNSCNVPNNYPDWLQIGRVDPYVVQLR